ncbi:MAG: UDP-N-acetylmuramoyl-L-alanine--D-glutamate ligase [Pseudomonadota bacterium]
MQLAPNTTHVIVGLGKTGVSCARWLHKQGVRFAAVDTREQPPGLDAFKREFADVQVECGELQAATLQQAKALVMSPGVDPRVSAVRSAVRAGATLTGDIDLFARTVQAPLVAITGSNAKSTVTTLVGEMAKAAGRKVAVCGNIGTPVLDLLDGAEYDLYVLELSSFQLETTHNLKAKVATVLNMSPDHMDRYDSMQAYHAAKHRIFQGCEQIVVNRDDALSRPLLSPSVQVSSFGLGHEDSNDFAVVIRGGQLQLAWKREALMPVSELKIAGQHNVANALAALALGHAVGLPFDSMLATLRTFPGLPHRCQWVATHNDVRWYNDSKGTNVGASVAAITGLGSSGKVILLAGGVGKGADFAELAPVMRKFGSRAILFGEDAGRIEEVLQGVVPVVRVDSLQSAVTSAHAEANKDELVLLSPACASFDMFNNYEHRGDVFTQLVRALA